MLCTSFHACSQAAPTPWDPSLVPFFGDVRGGHLSAGLTGLFGLAAYRAVSFAVAPGDSWQHWL